MVRTIFTAKVSRTIPSNPLCQITIQEAGTQISQGMLPQTTVIGNICQGFTYVYLCSTGNNLPQLQVKVVSFFYIKCNW